MKVNQGFSAGKKIFSWVKTPGKMFTIFTMMILACFVCTNVFENWCFLRIDMKKVKVSEDV